MSAIVAALSVITAVMTSGAGNAHEATAAAEWTILAVPARQTAFSGKAGQQFNQLCASCHSKDGRAQTPIARQRHVKDLSESRLPDAEIVEQILRGTHDKIVPFKMPAFNEKLARAEIEALVPLVKAFRPAPPAPSVHEPGHHRAHVPRLAGMINFDYDRFAVLEAAGSSGRYFILREMESHEGIALLKINPKKGRVKLLVGMTNPPVSRSLDNWVSRSRSVGVFGLLDRFGETLADAPHRVVLSGASTDLVLFLYSQFSGRTLLRSPRLPAARFDLNVLASGPERAAHQLQRALAARGIATIEDGDKFVLVVPRSETNLVQPFSSKMELSAGNDRRPELFPGGVIMNLPNVDLPQVVKLYADLTGREWDRNRELPQPTGTVNFTTRTALSNEECICALETLLNWHGLKVLSSGNDSFKVELRSPVPAVSAP